MKNKKSLTQQARDYVNKLNPQSTNEARGYFMDFWDNVRKSEVKPNKAKKMLGKHPESEVVNKSSEVVNKLSHKPKRRCVTSNKGKMKTRKQIIQDIDKIWKQHFDMAVGTGTKRTYKRSLSSRIASYIKKNFIPK